MDLSKIDIVGGNLLSVFYKIGFWVILIKCILDLIRGAMQGDLHSISQTVIKYVLLYAALYFVPFAMHLVEGVF